MHHFVAEYNEVRANGFSHNGVLFRITVTTVICDAPARALVKNIKSYSGYHGCDKCIQSDVWNGKMTFPETDATLRTDVSFDEMRDEEHHKGPSPFCWNSDRHGISVSHRLYASSMFGGHETFASSLDCPSFKALCETEINDTILQADDPVDRFTTTLHQLAIKTIPRTSIKSKKKKKPWFNDDCKTSIQKRKQALRQFNARPLHQNLEYFRIFRAKARRTIRESKRKSWKQYVSRLNSRTSIKKVWDMVRKIQGKGKSTSVNHLKKNNDNITSKKDIANTLADNFSKNSSSENYTSKFQNIKNQQEKQKLKFTSDNTENYNSEFLLSELTDALSKAHDTSPGPDDIHYQLLKHLPISTLLILLEIFNNIWKTGNIPKSWKEATVIPIPKPDKDHTDPTNYRPIALTSCICKTMKRMINDRLTWFLEANNIITDYQSGFRRHRSTNDHLVRLETFIREAFIKKEHLVTIFFDLEKAYDTTWKYGIMKNIHDIGLKGRLPLFIQNFLNDREFKIKVGSTLSELHKQEQGVPQGSILSVTLFSI